MSAPRESVRLKALATELSGFHQQIADEQAMPDGEVRAALHQLLFLRGLELMGHRVAEAAVLDGFVNELDRPSVRRVLARLRDPDGPWTTDALTPSGLAALHEIHLSTASGDQSESESSVRKRLGAYYTPEAIVEFLVGRACARLTGPPVPMARGELGDWTVLDPACGGGRFLVAALDWLLDWYREAWQVSVLAPTERLLIARRHLYGSDVDPLGVDIARLALALTLSRSGDGALFHQRELEHNVIVSDALRLRPLRQEQLTLSAGEAALGSLSGPLARGGFDLVIGNPPYASFSGRHAQRRPDSLPDSRFPARVRGGWPALHSLFVEHGIERLSRRLVAFVVPDQVGHLDSYEPVRRAVTRHAGLVDVRYWGEDVFPDVVSPILTFIADRRYSGRAAIESREGDLSRRRITGGARWRAVRSERLVTRLLAEGGSLGRLVGDPGVHTGNCAAKLIVAAGNAPRGAVPVLEGRLVDRYSCKPPNKYLRLDYDPRGGEYFRIGHEDRYAAASFVIRQTAAFPIVGPRLGAVYFRNSLLALSEPDGANIRFLVGVLNSTLMRVLYRLTVAESRQRAFPQVKVASLRRLPIKWPDLRCPGDRACHDRVVQVVDRLLELGASGLAPTEAEWARCEAELDALLFDFYRVTEAERQELIDSDPLAANAVERVAA